MKKYTYSSMYRGQQITKIVCAKSIKEASLLLEVNAYTIKTYAFINKIQSPFEGVLAYFDSGMLWNKRKDLIRKEMPLNELIKIIDYYINN